jgi:hypothetical protein
MSTPAPSQVDAREELARLVMLAVQFGDFGAFKDFRGERCYSSTNAQHDNLVNACNAAADKILSAGWQRVEWRPISEAKKDGTPYWLHTLGGDGEGWWDGKGWRFGSAYAIKPTHFYPFPTTPPKEGQ